VARRSKSNTRWRSTCSPLTKTSERGAGSVRAGPSRKGDKASLGNGRGSFIPVAKILQI
jgi:hypothetical protein